MFYRFYSFFRFTQSLLKPIKSLPKKQILFLVGYQVSSGLHNRVVIVWFHWLWEFMVLTPFKPGFSLRPSVWLCLIIFLAYFIKFLWFATCYSLPFPVIRLTIKFNLTIFTCACFVAICFRLSRNGNLLGLTHKLKLLSTIKAK